MKLSSPMIGAFVLLGIVLGYGTEVLAEVTLPNVIAEHMVIQRDKPVHLWGNAKPGERVSAEFRGNQADDTADDLGRWSIYLPPGQAGGPFTLSIRGTNHITFSDVLVGDVWLASGQSNMEFSVGPTPYYELGVLNADHEVASARLPNLRLFRADFQYSALPQRDLSGDTWAAATPETVTNFSAVAFFFGRELEKKEGIPIGLIEAAVGGSPIEAWTSMRALGSDSSLMPVFSHWSSEADKEAEAELKKKLQQPETDGKTHREQDKEIGPGKRVRFIGEAFSWLSHSPAYLYNAMIAPLTPFPVRGFIWYQGEDNALDGVTAPLYTRMLPTMIADWRARWGEGDLPFLFVQLANLQLATDVENSGWLTVWEAQRKALSVKNTGMAVTIDLGDPADIHPRNKQEVGHRLALWARASVYGEHVTFSGPLFRQAVPEGKHIRVWFNHAESGLTFRGAVSKGFEIAAADGKFVAASAEIDGDTVIVTAQNVSKPIYVRYGWSSNPECNLYNKDGLPASPFTSQP